LLGWPFKDIDENKVNQTFNLILSHIITDMDMDFAYYESFKLTVIVNKIRYHHLVDTTEEESELLNLFLNIYRYVIKPLNFTRNTNSSLNKEAFYQVFGPYIHKNLARNIKQLHKLKKQHNSNGLALTQLERNSINFCAKWQVTINLDNVMFAFLNTAMNAMDLLASDFIFYDRNKHFIDMFQKQLSKLYPELKHIVVEFCRNLSLTNNDTLIIYTQYLNNWAYLHLHHLFV